MLSKDLTKAYFKPVQMNAVLLPTQFSQEYEH